MATLPLIMDARSLSAGRDCANQRQRCGSFFGRNSPKKLHPIALFCSQIYGVVSELCFRVVTLACEIRGRRSKFPRYAHEVRRGSPVPLNQAIDGRLGDCRTTRKLSLRHPEGVQPFRYTCSKIHFAGLTEVR